MDTSRDDKIEQASHDTHSEEKMSHRSWGGCCAEWSREVCRNDRVDAVGWAVIFIWAALVLLAEATDFAANFGWWDGWSVFFIGAGAIVLLEAVFRLLVPACRGSWMRSLVFGIILLCIGLGDLIDWRWILILVLLVIGIAKLRSAFAHRG